jgi:hypothetical protein
VKLYSRPGNDLTHRFPLIVEALARLRSRSCIIDGEAVACGADGIAWHYGTNIGSEPVRLLVIDQVEAGQQNTISSSCGYERFGRLRP